MLHNLGLTVLSRDYSRGYYNPIRGNSPMHNNLLLGPLWIRRLIEGRADVNALDAFGWAPLHLAAGAGLKKTSKP